MLSLHGSINGKNKKKDVFIRNSLKFETVYKCKNALRLNKNNISSFRFRNMKNAKG